MEFTRRQFVMVSLAAMATGCSSARPGLVAARPRPAWPSDHLPPHVPTPPAPPPPPPPPPTATVTRPTVAPVGPLRAIPRSRWAKGAPIRSRLEPMRAINRITIHHEGSTPVWFNDAGSTAERLDMIRRSHLDRLVAGDIGYHFVIDRAGRLWEARQLKYQGAHVKDNNPYNLGIMCLGNFDLQRPTDNQLATLGRTLPQLMRRYRVPTRRVYTHQELKPTRCPGTSLQSHMVALRSGRRLG